MERLIVLSPLIYGVLTYLIYLLAINVSFRKNNSIKRKYIKSIVSYIEDRYINHDYLINILQSEKVKFLISVEINQYLEDDNRSLGSILKNQPLDLDKTKEYILEKIINKILTLDIPSKIATQTIKGIRAKTDSKMMLSLIFSEKNLSDIESSIVEKLTKYIEIDLYMILNLEISKQIDMLASMSIKSIKDLFDNNGIDICQKIVSVYETVIVNLLTHKVLELYSPDKLESILYEIDTSNFEKSLKIKLNQFALLSIISGVILSLILALIYYVF